MERFDSILDSALLVMLDFKFRLHLEKENACRPTVQSCTLMLSKFARWARYAEV